MQSPGRGIAKRRLFGAARRVGFGGVDIGDAIFGAFEPECVAVDDAVAPAAVAKPEACGQLVGTRGSRHRSEVP
jgi:hypothetical protein